MKLKYKKRRKYKYNLHSEVQYPTGISTAKEFESNYLKISESGHLTVKEGYSWDGPSGPALDTKNFMMGSLVHDALYQLMREKVLPQSDRKRADELLKEICICCGMSKFRAWYVYNAVRLAAGSAAKPDMKKAPYCEK